LKPSGKDRHGNLKLSKSGNGIGADLYSVDQLLAAFASGKNRSAKKEARYSAPGPSDREGEIVYLVAVRPSNQEMCERLVISITTVKPHVGNILKNLVLPVEYKPSPAAKGLGFLPQR
jgi:DNA-binding NarL/FixJ family response regulator